MAGATPRRVALAFVALAGAFALWNALAYPVGAGYDAASHREYADFVVREWRLPRRNETPEYYSPPLYYVVAGLTAKAGRAAGLGEPDKLVQLLNVPIVVGILLLTLALARLLWPGRRWLGAAAAGFLVACPLLLKTASMFNPEPLDTLLSVAALVLAARALGGSEPPTLRRALALGVVLGLGQLTRQFALWTLAVVALAFLAAWLRSRDGGILRALAVALAAAVVIAGPWYGYRAVEYGNAVFDRPTPVPKPFFQRRPASFYVDLGLPQVFSAPYRPHFVNRAPPQTYADLWGDWYGVYGWNARAGRPGTAARVRLGAQDVLGLVPTALALGGWLVLLARSGLRLDGPRLLAALLPLAGLAGYLYFTIGYPTRDGDVLKPTYMLTTMPAWALCFGFAADRLGRGRWLLLALAVLLLPFAVYRGALGLF